MANIHDFLGEDKPEEELPRNVQLLNESEEPAISESERLAIMPSLEEFMKSIAQGVTIGVRDIAEITEFVGLGGRVSEVEKLGDRGMAGSGPTGPTLLGEAVTGAAGGIADFLGPVGTDPTESIVGGITREISRMAVGMKVVGPIVRGAGATGRYAHPFITGAIVDLAIYGPYEERLSNLVADLPPGTRFEILRQVGIFMQSDPEDPQALAKLKQVVEGGFTGLAIDAVLGLSGRTIAVARAARRARIARSRGTYIPDTVMPLDSVRITDADVQAALIAEDLLQTPYGVLEIPEPGPLGDSHLQTGKVTIPSLELENVPLAEARSRILTDEFTRQIRPLLDDGRITQENFEAKAAWFKEHATKVYELPNVGPNTGVDVLARFDQNDLAVVEARNRDVERAARPMRRVLTEGLVDRAGTMRRDILQAGPEGQNAMMLFDLAAGANPKSTWELRRAVNRIFRTGSGPFSRQIDPGDLADLNRIIQARRLQEIRRYRVDSEYESELIGSVGEAQAMLEEMSSILGSRRFNELNRRADTYFEITQQKTDELLDAGLISADEHLRLSHFDYAPMEYLDRIDPGIAEIAGPGGRTISINSSGIRELDSGSARALENDYEKLLGQVVFRANSSIFRNRANRALLRVAEANDNPAVRTNVEAADRHRWTRISTFVEGEEKRFFIRTDLAAQWSSDPISTHQLVQIMSGSAFVRPMATGLNPEFGLANMPRDIMLIWFQSGLYNPLYRGGGFQFGADLARVAPDAFRRVGRFDDYIDQGGGMNFLTHQGQIFNADIAQSPKGLQAVWRGIQETAGYFGETTEIWTRLAARERELRNLTRENGGVELPNFQERATWRARNYLDFNQGGVWTKHLDSAFPYINAGAQGIRSFARVAKEDPAGLGVKIAEISAIYAGFNLANRLAYPEAWDDVPPEVKAGNIVLMTGMNFQDDRGERRHVYFRIPIDHTTTWLKGSIDTIMDAQIGGRAPDQATIDSLKAGLEGSIGVVPGLSMIPSVNAMNALLFNVDSFGNEIWRGSEVLSPRLRYYQYPSRSTSPLAVDVGDLVNLPPAQLEVALRSVLPQNIYTNAVNMPYTVMREGIPQDLIDAQMPELLSRMPFSRRYMGITHPATREREFIETGQREEADRTEIAKRQLDEMTFRMFNEPGSIRQDTVNQFIQNVTEQDRFFGEKLERRHNDLRAMLRIFERTNYEDIGGMPARSTWFQLQDADPTTRARSFAEFWDMSYADPDPQNGQARRRLLREMLRRVPGFDDSPAGKSPEFAHQLNLEHVERRSQVRPDRTWR